MHVDFLVVPTCATITSKQSSHKRVRFRETEEYFPLRREAISVTLGRTKDSVRSVAVSNASGCFSHRVGNKALQITLEKHSPNA